LTIITCIKAPEDEPVEHEHVVHVKCQKILMPWLLVGVSEKNSLMYIILGQIFVWQLFRPKQRFLKTEPKPNPTKYNYPVLHIFVKFLTHL
jgi:hypothetical protein